MNLKKLLVLTGFVALAHPLSARQFSSATQLAGINHRINAAPLPKASNATGSRIISAMFRSHDGSSYVYGDTLNLLYSGTHIGDFAGIVEYDSYTDKKYNTATSAFENYELNIQTFDANDDITERLLKSWNGSTNTYDNFENYIMTYDAGHNKMTQVEQHWNSATSTWENYQKHSYSYDAGNNMLTDITQGWNSTTSSWDNLYQYLYTYNAANIVTMRIDQYWDFVNLAWKNSYRDTYTYDANNNQLTDLYKKWDAATATWINYRLTTNTFGVANEMLTTIEQDWNTSTSSYDNKSRTTNSSFTNAKPQLSIEEAWDNATSSFKNKKRTQIGYNSYGQYTLILVDSWNVGGFWQPVVGDIKYNLYYEEFATEVKDLASKGGEAKVYPVPAHDKLNIDLSWSEPQPFTVSIIDITGRLSRQWQVASTASYHTAISVSELPFGTYFIKIDGTKGQVVKQLILSSAN